MSGVASKLRAVMLLQVLAAALAAWLAVNVFGVAWLAGVARLAFLR